VLCKWCICAEDWQFTLDTTGLRVIAPPQPPCRRQAEIASTREGGCWNNDNAIRVWVILHWLTGEQLQEAYELSPPASTSPESVSRLRAR
jgi:hypothetical protein